MFGGSGFDWADYKDTAIGVTIDIDGRFFDQPPVPGSGASALARFDIMEGLSGSKHDDYLFGRQCGRSHRRRGRRRTRG